MGSLVTVGKILVAKGHSLGKRVISNPLIDKTGYFWKNNRSKLLIFKTTSLQTFFLSQYVNSGSGAKKVGYHTVYILTLQCMHYSQS